MQIIHGNRHTLVQGLDQSSGTTNYFIGNDPQKWRTNIHPFGKVQYKDVYRGVDLVFYGNQRQLEYDFKVAPGVNPRKLN